MKKGLLKHKLLLGAKLEKKLLPRLKFLGWILICFGFAALTYAITIPSDESPLSEKIEEEEGLETSGLSLEQEIKPQKEIIYLGIISFWIIGVSCVLFAQRRKKHL